MTLSTKDSQAADQVSEQARLAAREFVARWARETGEPLSAVVTDRMLFAYEMGFLRGRTIATRDVSKMLGDLSQAPTACKGEKDDATE